MTDNQPCQITEHCARIVVTCSQMYKLTNKQYTTATHCLLTTHWRQHSLVEHITAWFWNCGICISANQQSKWSQWRLWDVHTQSLADCSRNFLPSTYYRTIHLPQIERNFISSLTSPHPLYKSSSGIPSVSLPHSFIHFFKINNDKAHCCDNNDTPSKIRVNSHIVIKVQ